MNKVIVSGLALLLLVSGVSAFYFGAFDFSSSKRFQPHLNTVPLVVLTPSFSVVLNDVVPTSPAPVMTGFAQNVIFTINSNRNNQYRVTAIFTTNNQMFGLTEHRQQLANALRGQNTRAIHYGSNEILQGSIRLEVCSDRTCVLSAPYNAN